VTDWAKLKPLPLDSGPLAEQLEVAERICEALGGDAYAIETVFNPLSIAGDLVGSEQILLDHMRSDPQAIHGALEVITETFTGFARAVVESGADGIFFATTNWATRDILTDEQYAEFGRPYDLRVLAAVQDAAFNVLHVCKNHAMVLELGDYPVNAINWAVGSPGNPPLRQVQLEAGKCVIGGIRNETLQQGTPPLINAEARAAREATGGRWWMLGPACSIAVDTPEPNVRAVRDIAEQMTGNQPVLSSEE
jgi:uroporphyrinogen decarboxylase